MILCQATCPHCRSLLFFPAEWRHLLLRCKTCGQVFREATSLTSPVLAGTNGQRADQGFSTAGEQGKAVMAGSVGSAAVVPQPRFPATTSAPMAPPALAAAANHVSATPTANIGSKVPYPPAGISLPRESAPVSTAPALSPFEQILLRRRRMRWIKLGVAAMVLTTAVLVLLACWPIFQPTLSSWWSKIVQAWSQTGRVQVAEDDQDATGDDSSSQDQRANGRNTGEATSHPSKPAGGGKRSFDGRALLVGIQNYFYLNPVNSGAQQNQNKAPGQTDYDPLGFRTFRQRLVNMGFRNECIGELSDVAEKNPHPPLKASIEETIKLFCEESRPQDSVLLAFVGHILVREDKVYLAPIDAKLDSPPEKLVALEWLYQQLGQCKARHKVLILDVAHLDPQEGVLRGKEMPLPPEAEKVISQPPEGVLVWLSCSANQFSYSFGGYGLVGSVFFHMLNESTYTGPDIQGRRNRQALEKAEPFPEWDLPLLRLSKRINDNVKAYLKSLGDLQQEPKLLGKLAGGPPPAPNDPLAAVVTLKFAPLPEKPVEAEFVDLILQEIRARINKDRPLRAAALPPFWAKDLEKYKPDYADLKSLQALLNEKPLRKAVFEALDLLDKHERQLRMSFQADSNVENFRKQIMREQENLAIADQELFEFKEKLDKIRAAHRDQETLRWRANFDLVYARFIGRMALYREYNFVIGNRLRRDPTLQNPEKNNGWKIVPSERLQQKETRELAKERDKVLEAILKEHPNTPWEFLAERERATSLGLKVEEAKVSP